MVSAKVWLVMLLCAVVATDLTEGCLCKMMDTYRTMKYVGMMRSDAGDTLDMDEMMAKIDKFMEVDPKLSWEKAKSTIDRAFKDGSVDEAMNMLRRAVNYINPRSGANHEKHKSPRKTQL